MKGPRTFALVVLVLLSACTGSSTTTSPTAATTPSPTSTSNAPTPSQPRTGTIVAEPVATDLDHPATFVFDDSGAIFYGERLTGEIRRIDPATGKDTSVFTIPHVVGDVANEQGLVGLTLPPDFPKDPWLYAYATRMVNGVARDQIVRIPLHGDRGTSMHLVLDVQVAGERHNGGRMLFGPDGMLARAGRPASVGDGDTMGKLLYPRRPLAIGAARAESRAPSVPAPGTCTRLSSTNSSRWPSPRPIPCAELARLQYRFGHEFKDSRASPGRK